MSQRNLPLATLRTFEAVARHQSLSKAATELHLTDSAVSHQMRRLEASLGQELFVRVGRGIVLTDAGRTFARAVTASLRSIADAAEHLGEMNEPGGPLTIACPPMFANTWLAKHLNDFCNVHPSIECHIRLVDNRLVPEIPDIDVGIAFGSGGWADRRSALLARVNVTPVCSPQLFEQLGGAMTHPSDIRHTRLLHWDDGSEWRRWLAKAGIPEVEKQARHLYCSDLAMAIDLSIHGTGLALVSDPLSSIDFKRGLLIKPFPTAIDAVGGWYTITTTAGERRSGTLLFQRWLLDRFR